MLRRDFHYELPERLIAQQPLAERGASRLLCLDGQTGAMSDRRFNDLPTLLKPGDLLVLNDTRVIPARLLGRKDSGGRAEVLVERVVDGHRALAHIRASKPPQAGSVLLLEDALAVTVLGREGALYELDFGAPVLPTLDAHGRIPLPPYITRAAQDADRERYQTVYNRHPGAVAAPTAGLHFDERLLGALAGMGVNTAYVTLHVGAGTFQPVRTERLDEHSMHPEYVEVRDAVCAQIAATRNRGGRVVAVGTTVVRSLESAAQSGALGPYQGETRLFIYPGYQFKVVDSLLTNFHLPESTLLMLVCALGGYERVMAAYRHAIVEGYRFFSYGDAMFVTGQMQDTGAKVEE